MHRSRRQFLAATMLGPLAVRFTGRTGSLWAQTRPAAAPRYDLLIRGGTLIDPAENLSGPRDIAIIGTKVARVAPSIPGEEARAVIDASRRIVTPGLIDLHTHVYDGVAPLGIPADPNCIARGVTTAVDAGSAGAHTFPGLRRFVIERAATRIYALLNISVIGQSSMSPGNPYGELLDLRYANPKIAIDTIERNRDVILGVKIRLTRTIAGDHDIEALKLAREAADAVKLPLMVHIGGTASPLPRILAELRGGDVITHSFHGHPGGVIDDNGRVLPEVRRAVDRGVRLDIGHGAGSFAFNTAEKALAQDLLPGTISSDVHQWNYGGPVFDLATTLSKFLHLGLTLDQVIARATAHPAATFGFPKGLGTLREGSEADVAIFQLDEGDFRFRDSMGEIRMGGRLLRPVATVKAGLIYGGATLPVAGSELRYAR